MSTFDFTDMTNYQNSLNESISQIQVDSEDMIDDDIDAKNQELLEKQMRQKQQLNEIDEKNKLILTRARMLQLSQEKNSYKKKIIYSLIAIILLILILTLSTYVYFSRKKGGSNSSL